LDRKADSVGKHMIHPLKILFEGSGKGMEPWELKLGGGEQMTKMYWPWKEKPMEGFKR